MVNWMATESELKINHLAEFQNSYKDLTKADSYMNFHFYRGSAVSCVCGGKWCGMVLVTEN